MQLNLLTIRQQPAPREPRVPSKVIRAYVKANMRNFARRQAERERLRAEKQARRKPKSERPPQEENHPNMRQIKVTYRAVFQQPTGPLNPMNLNLPGPCPVEIFGQGSKWQAREIASPRRHVYIKAGEFSSPIHAMQEISAYFRERLETWQIWGKPHNELQERMLLPGEICDLGNGKMGWLDDEDRTHILHGPLIDPNARVPNAACGAKVNTKCFISTKANVEPTCKGCREVWRREYQNR